MISVETKTFENGVLRMIGMSKWNCISMILIQSLTFVLPSIILGYASSIPLLMLIFNTLFKNVDVQVSLIPSVGATIQAVLLGLLIPLISSIVPIQSAMNK